jgi:hypothetical protein
MQKLSFFKDLSQAEIIHINFFARRFQRYFESELSENDRGKCVYRQLYHGR